jgi:WD40 repeat protein
MKRKKEKKNEFLNQEEPEIYALKKENEGFSLSRKEFLGAIGMIGAALTINPKLMAEKILDQGQFTSGFFAHDGFIDTLCFSADGKSLLSGSRDNSYIKYWSFPEGKILKRVTGNLAEIYSIKQSIDGTEIIVGENSKYLNIYSFPKLKQKKSLEGHADYIRSIAISPDGNIIVSASWDKTIKIWSVKEKKEIKTLEGHTAGVESVCFSPDGKMMASGDFDNNIFLWNVSEMKIIKALQGHTDGIMAVSFSPDGKTLASGSIDKTVKIWSIPDGRALKTFQCYSIVNSIALALIVK